MDVPPLLLAFTIAVVSDTVTVCVPPFIYVLACVDDPYLTNLRSKQQQSLCVDFMLVLLQEANQAAVGQVLHHQTHSEAPCIQGDNPNMIVFL